MKDLFDISNKIALVTGGTQGIGEAIVEAYLQAGARVAVNARNPQKLDAFLEKYRDHHDHLIGVVADLRVESEIIAMVEKVRKQLGPIDILVNNAGIVKRLPTTSHDLEDWNAVIETNLTAPFILCKEVGASMIEQGGGKIINIASLASEVAMPTLAAYAAAKGGIKMLTRALTAEWAQHNIQVNGIGPGYIATPINTSYRADGNPINDYILARTPAERWGLPEDMSGTAIFLASPASDFINGQIIYVDGGYLSSFGKPYKRATEQ